MRNFIYLDSDKLRSYSSQLFEGIADIVVRSEHEESEETEQQKAKIGSGRTLADIFKKSRSTTEMRFLEDHAYTIFENEISSQGKLLEISDDNFNLDHPFIKVTGPTRLNDTKATRAIVSRFNEVGLALFTATNFQDVLANALGKVPPEAEMKKMAAQGGMQMHPRLLSSLETLIEFGYNELLEVQINFPKVSFSAPLKRSFLREDETKLVQKYSRLPHKNFTVIGTVAQIKSEIPTLITKDVKDGANIKEALRTLSEHMHVMEDTFLGPSEGEIFLDPIAIYLEF